MHKIEDGDTMAIRSNQPLRGQPDTARSGNSRADAAFVAEVGRLVRRGRARRGITRRQLASLIPGFRCVISRRSKAAMATLP